MATIKVIICKSKEAKKRRYTRVKADKFFPKFLLRKKGMKFFQFIKYKGILTVQLKEGR